MAPRELHFSRHTLDFIEKAGRQKRADWLDRHRDEYERLVLNPLQHLASELKNRLSPLAPGYHFPQKGIGRLKRAAFGHDEGATPFKDWLSYSAARPRQSRFTHNPNLYFMINPSDPEDRVLAAGGLYLPSSQQLRALRAAVAQNPGPFDELFASKAFARCFPGGFSSDKIASRAPRGFDPNHPRIEWIKLQAFFVWKPYTLREFTSLKFVDIVERDWKQILRLNQLLDAALRPATRVQRETSSKLSERLNEIGDIRPREDF